MYCLQLKLPVVGAGKEAQKAFLWLTAQLAARSGLERVFWLVRAVTEVDLQQCTSQ